MERIPPLIVSIGYRRGRFICCPLFWHGTNGELYRREKKWSIALFWQFVKMDCNLWLQFSAISLAEYTFRRWLSPSMTAKPKWLYSLVPSVGHVTIFKESIYFEIYEILPEQDVRSHLLSDMFLENKMNLWLKFYLSSNSSELCQ